MSRKQWGHGYYTGLYEARDITISEFGKVQMLGESLAYEDMAIQIEFLIGSLQHELNSSGHVPTKREQAIFRTLWAILEPHLKRAYGMDDG